MKKLILIFVSVLLSACGSMVKEAQNQTIPAVDSKTSQIVFMRSTIVNALVNTTIYDVTSGTPKLVGNIPNGSKVVAEVAPGHHVFFVSNGASQDFMLANVLPNKSYYVVVRAIWPANFTMRPVRNKNGEFLYGSSDFKSLVKGTNIVFDTPKSIKEFEDKRDWVSKNYKIGWNKWKTKSNEDKAILTLNSDDYYR